VITTTGSFFGGQPVASATANISTSCFIKGLSADMIQDSTALRIGANRRRRLPVNVVSDWPWDAAAETGDPEISFPM